MKSAIIAVCIFACAYATSDENAQTLSSTNEQKPDGSFQYGFQSDNGISGQAVGQVKVLGKDEVALQIEGSNSYISPEGAKIDTSYVANENGYQPQGAHLPTPPAPQPIPDYIQRSLDYIKAHPYVEKKL